MLLAPLPARKALPGLLLAALACRAPGLPAQPPAGSQATAAPKPSLVVMLSIDQMRGDYLDRYAHQYTGGLKRLRTGTHYTRAMHDHAITETAPGHASLLSGRYPVHTNIASNSDGVGDKTSPLIDAVDMGASPLRFRGTALVDWMTAADRRTRFLSVSRKDRSAILPVGRAKGDVYWYASNGLFTQSTYYSRSLPSWVKRFNDRKLPAQYAGWTWNLLLPASDYPEPDSVPAENSGRRAQFPYTVAEQPEMATGSLSAFPVMDELTLEFALAGIAEKQLGSDPNRTDLLAVSLSTTDAIGHRFGPDSRELHDQLLRVDRYLGTFFDSLFARVDSSRVVIVLSSDHGVTPFPSVRSTYTPNHNAKMVDLRTTMRAWFAELHALGVDTMQVEYDYPTVMFGDTSSFVKRRLSVDSVVNALAQRLRALPGVHRIDTPRSLLRADTASDAIARRWLHSFAPGPVVRLMITLDRYSVPSNARQALHGSPWDEDAWVPIVFWGAPFKHQRIDRPVRTVDIAPTLARLLNVRPLERVDGVVLGDAFR